jgi:anti-sigma B factor antagonist
MPEELDLVTVDDLVENSCAAIARPRLLLLTLTGLSFCDARGLGALVRVSDRADAAGCRYGLIAPRPSAGRMLRIGGLNRRLLVFATIEDALADLACPVAQEEYCRGVAAT